MEPKVVWEKNWVLPKKPKIEFFYKTTFTGKNKGNCRAAGAAKGKNEENCRAAGAAKEKMEEIAAPKARRRKKIGKLLRRPESQSSLIKKLAKVVL